MNQYCRLLFSVLIPLTIAAQGLATQIFVSPSGDDMNPGTFALPFVSISKAHSVVTAGDTIILRGGVYALSSTIPLSKSGNTNARFYLIAYSEERPVLDFSSMTTNSSNRGFRLSGSYWHIKGIDIKGAGDNGMYLSGTDNIIENCAFYENRDTGLQLGSGASRNRIINCDSFFNVDPPHENADGFAAKLDVGTGNFFYGCRAWQNSDDGWDGYLRGADDVTTTLENCWVFNNGYLKDGSPSNGNGNGIKMGGSDDRTLRHNIILKRCLTFDNRVKGFDQNNNRGSMTLYNCTAYRNGINYSITSSLVVDKSLTVTNCLSLGAYGSIGGFAIQMTNSWNSQFTVSPEDFVSTDTTAVRGLRKLDGSLPDIRFMHLAEGSDLIDAGTDVGSSYSGRAPDLGAFEWTPVTQVVVGARQASESSVLWNYPNPFNTETNIMYGTETRMPLVVEIYDLAGREIKELANQNHFEGSTVIRWDGTSAFGTRVASGIYFAVVQFGTIVRTLKLQLLK